MIFEAVMLICFGAAWPFSIWKSYSSRKNDGKSLLFLCIVLLGYISGIIYKIAHNYNAVILFFILNAVMVAVDIGIYGRNKRMENKPGPA
ncbi:MAG: hypothetical protein PHO00_08295 [bacterium]|nr:hypothetical protein [bacterium]